MENNSTGARPKTSSVSEKSKKKTVVKKKFLKVLIMNASGDNQGKGSATRRKQTIVDIIKEHNPDLILFQEFTWKKIHGKTWPSDPVPEHFQLTGNDDASIMFNINELIVIESTTIKLQSILEKLQKSTSKHPTPIPLDFAPIPRMSLRVVKTKGVPVMEFICISWHGNHAGMTNDQKVNEFTHLMIFLNKIYVMSQLPLLIAGDFNVGMESICHEVKEPFKLYEYEASDRRKKKGVIDYYIASIELHLSKMEPVDLTKDSKAEKPEDVLDHDPIIAMLKLAHHSTKVPALDNATVKISKKNK